MTGFPVISPPLLKRAIGGVAIRCHTHLTLAIKRKQCRLLIRYDRLEMAYRCQASTRSTKLAVFIFPDTFRDTNARRVTAITPGTDRAERAFRTIMTGITGWNLRAIRVTSACTSTFDIREAGTIWIWVVRTKIGTRRRTTIYRTGTFSFPIRASIRQGLPRK